MTLFSSTSKPANIPPGNYDKLPVVSVAGHSAISGYAEVFAELDRQARRRSEAPVVVIDAYPGTDLDELQVAARAFLPGYELMNAEQAALDDDALQALLARNLTDDRVFGVMSVHQLPEFYDPLRLEALRTQITRVTRPLLVYGWGASLVAPAATLTVVADLARWEIQRRLRAGLSNWHASNGADDMLHKYKRGFFTEWRVADRHKRGLFGQMAFYLETNTPGQPVMITAQTFWASLDEAVRRPFRVVPFFDPGVWGGQWMKEVCGLDRSATNYAWCFDGVPEENSLLFRYGGAEPGVTLEMPALNLVMTRPTELLGPLTYSRFGAEFPIRFDLLDTMDGGNLSLQVHPLTSYIQEYFGMHYTQDESYYLLDAGPDAVVYLGLRPGVDRQAMLEALEASQHGEAFPAERYVNVVPARKHDHFPIPAGTLHCSGRNAMVLEISATPFIFTFKLWDWGRVGLDGQPRPIHFAHGAANIRWDRDADWVDAHLLNLTEPLDSGPGWREERTGLDHLQFIETRRHWFSVPVTHHTGNTVNVLNLIEGREAVVESPGGTFEPFHVHYAETFFIPAGVGEYVIRPVQDGEQLATIKAFVRGTSDQ